MYCIEPHFSIFSENCHNYLRHLLHGQRLSVLVAFKYSEVANFKKIQIKTHYRNYHFSNFAEEILPRKSEIYVNLATHSCLI